LIKTDISQSTILIIDDDKKVLNSLRLQLKEYSILTSENGLDALCLLENNNISPDLIISDIVMPKMDGFQFVGKLREIDNLYYIPIIFITGFFDQNYKEKSMHLGAIDFIEKPFLKSELLLKVKNFLEFQKNFKSNLIKEINAKSIDNRLLLNNNLTRREIEIASFAASFLPSKEISIHMNISKRTVENHLQKIYKKLSISSRDELKSFFI